MNVCACGQPMPRGSGWCRKCYMFWTLWWARYSDMEHCSCEECCRQRQYLQPFADSVERKNLEAR